MAELFSYASKFHPVWSPFAAEIHDAVWKQVRLLEKVQGFVRQWAGDRNRRRDETRKQARDDFERTGKGVPALSHCSYDGQLCRLPNPGACPQAHLLPAVPCQPDDPKLPLPPDHDSRLPVEKWASLAAIHDVYRMDGDKINPWPVPAEFNDLSVPADKHFLERTRQWATESYCYGQLIDEAKRLSKGHKSVIEGWLKEVVADAAEALAAVEAHASATADPQAAAESAAPAQPQGTARATGKGVSLLDAALILTEEDDPLARQKKSAWQRLRTPTLPTSIGKCPNHSQVKLYAPSAVADFVEGVEGKPLCTQYRLRQRLVAKAREPRQK